jgi:tripartite ATP-independent transporter DctM subunit
MEILIIFTGLLIAFLLIGIPVGYTIALTSIVALVIKWGLPNLSFGMIAQMLIYGINNFPIIAVPLFLLAGALMNQSGISRRIFGFANALVGSIRGGLAHVNILASFIFSGMSGAAAADVAGLGQIEIKAMEDAGYDKDYSCAVTGASATIGPVVPPSIPLVLFGVLANTSVTKLFIGGIIPGVLMVITMIALSSYLAVKRNYPRGNPFRIAMLLKAFKEAFLPLLTPVIIIGGIWTGVFTPTEAAAVAALYAVLLGAFIYREVRLKALWANLKDVAVTSAAILFILACATIYNTALTRTKVPQLITEALFAVSHDPLIILILLNLMLFIAGCFMSTAITISLFTPLLAPLFVQFGIDPLHFGIVMVLNLMLGQLTPPFGIVLYVLMRVGDIDFDRLVKAVVPFYIPILIVLILIIAVPSLVTFLPNLVLAR